MMTLAKHLEALNERLEKGKALVGKVHPILGVDNVYAIEGEDGFYMVHRRCTCPDAKYRVDLHQGWCKHKIAVELYEEAHT